MTPHGAQVTMAAGGLINYVGERPMTEQEWQASTHPRKMLKFLKAKASERQLRLFAVACCRLRFPAWDLGDLAERYADGQVTSEEMSAIAENALRTAGTWYRHMEAEDVDRARALIGAATARDGDKAATLAVKVLGVEHRPAGAQLLRDIIGNPLHPPPPLDPAVLAWNDGTVRRLAETAYRERHLPSGDLDRGRLAILADALLDAGCADEDLIAHCRGPGPHVRGCWAVDAILGNQ